MTLAPPQVAPTSRDPQGDVIFSPIPAPEFRSLLTVRVRDVSGDDIRCKVHVDPPGEDVNRWEREYDSDQGVELTAKSCRGYSFVRWEVCWEEDEDGGDGGGEGGEGGEGGLHFAGVSGDRKDAGRGEFCKISTEKSILVLMGTDKKVRAIYRKRGRGLGLKNSDEMRRALRSLGNFPAGWSALPGPGWGALWDLLPSGRWFSGAGGPLLVVGSPDEMGEYWEDLSTWPPGGFEFSWDEWGRAKMAFDGREYSVEPGIRDYCLVAAILPQNCVGTCWPEIRLTGLTGRGTRAGLLWLLDNAASLYPGTFVLLEWFDSNGDGKVQVEEVSVVAAGAAAVP